MAQVIELHRVEAPGGELKAAVRGTLRQVLGGRLGVAPADVDIQVDGHGRPWVEGVAFSVSHSAELGLIAVAEAGRRVGVDVEQVRPDTDFRALAARFFHPDEAAAIGDRRDAFFRCWARKEAVVKALGVGLAHPLDSFVVEVDVAGASAVRGVDGVRVTGLPIDSGYVAALAADGEPEFNWAG